MDTLVSKFHDVKEMMNDAIRRGKGKWFNNVNSYRIELGLTWEELKNLDRKSLKKIIRGYDNECWAKGPSEKQSARFYASEKKSIKY